jgi:ATP-binding cassette subfamily F protein 3
MITLRNLTLARAGRNLLEGVDLTLHARQKIGVVGANGCGKSSLFALLRGELHQEAGDLDMPPGLVVAHVAQDTPALPDAALEHVLDGDAELRSIEGELARAESAAEGESLALLHERYAQVDGYSARARAAALLHGLGFSDDDLGKPVAEFSGGWRVRLNLARALMCRSDLLLLDEPTNHLDLEAVIWLEAWLKNYRGTLLLISHDREFLDNTVSHVCHFERRRLRLYPGNYGDFERQRAASLALQQAMYERQQREIAHLHSFIERFRAKATKARQAQSRLKALARIEELAPAHVDAPFTFAFRSPEGSPDPLLVLENVACGYDGYPMLEGVTFTLRAGQRVGLLGPNGAGKSTLIRVLAGIHAPLTGARREGKGLRIGYFAQHQLEQLRADESPLQHLTRLSPRSREQELRDFLGGFNFVGDMATADVGPLSGGEKSRLALALLIWQGPNLLLLDEPTNHLDLEMRLALTLALQDYEGALVLVSHDRHLLRTTTDDLFLVADGGFAPFDGDLDDYRAWLSRRETGEQATAALDSDKVARKRQREQEAAQRQTLLARRRPLQKELAAIEGQLATWQAERALLDRQLADPAHYQSADSGALQAQFKRQTELAQWIEAAEERWLHVQDALENLDET